MAPALVAVGVITEAVGVLGNPLRWGRNWVYYNELEELVDWLDDHVRPKPVLANFGVSASILGYAGCPVILHPKFEAPRIRERVRSYGEELFKGTETSFRDWADSYGARYYVYALGEFSPIAPDVQMRYFVNALRPATNSPAYLFEFAPDTCVDFRVVWQNQKYRVFKIRGRSDRIAAEGHARDAESAMETGDVERAGDRAAQALLLDPDNARAQRVLKHVGALEDQGFRNAGE